MATPVVFLIVFTVLHSVYATRETEQASYHLAMVKRSIDQIRKGLATTGTSSRSHVTKRSVSSDLILMSLDKYCVSFKSDPLITKHFKQKEETQPLSTKQITGHTRLDSKDNSYGSVSDRQELNVFPLKIQAEREKDKVWLLFHTAHSETAVISRIDPYHFQEKVLELSDDVLCKQKVVSKSRFAIELPNKGCTADDKLFTSTKYVPASFQFTSQYDDKYTLTTEIDVCRYDKKFDYNRADWNNIKKIFSEYVPYPKYHLTPDVGDSILLKLGTEFEIELVVNITTYHTFSIRLVSWNELKKKTTQSSVALIFEEIKYLSSDVKIEFQKTNFDNEDEEFMTVKLLNKTTVSTNTFSVSLKIILSSPSGNHNGKLHLVYTQTYSNTAAFVFPVVSKVKVERIVTVESENHQQTLPADVIYFDQEEIIQCKDPEEWKDVDPIFGKNCTVRCQATGQDISSISIATPSKLPFASMSYSILPHTALAILDVGPPSSAAEGSYQCMVVNVRGQSTTRQLTLYTRLFTKLKSFYFRRTGIFYTETAIIKCIAYGDKDMEMSITVFATDDTNGTRLDTNESYKPNITINEDHNTTTLKLTVPWKDLKIPRTKVHCDARSKRGSDVSVINLSRYYENSYNVYPRINVSATTIRHSLNGTVNITCTAYGAQPMNMWISVVSPANENPMAAITKSTEIELEKMVLTYTIDSAAVPDRYKYRIHAMKFYCMAKNKYRSAEKRIQQRDYY